MQFNIFAGKSSTERNKIIAAIVLGVFSLFSLLSGSAAVFLAAKPTVTVKTTASPTPTASPLTAVSRRSKPLRRRRLILAGRLARLFIIPEGSARLTQEEISSHFTNRRRRHHTARHRPRRRRQLHRNQHEPTPTPPICGRFCFPGSVYAGQKTFRLEVSGDKFQPDSQILFNGTPLPTTFISPQQLVAEVPESLITSEGARTIIVVSPDGKYSNQFSL